MALKKLFEEYDSTDDIDELKDILEEMKELMSRANSIVFTVSQETNPIIYERWRAYPYGHIMSSLAGGSRYETKFSDIIRELEMELGMEDDYEDEY